MRSPTEILDRKLKRAAALALVFALAGIAAVWFSTRPPTDLASPNPARVELASPA